MAFFISRKNRKYNKISHEVENVLKTQKDSDDRKRVFKEFHREIANDYNVSHLCFENIPRPEDLEKIVEKLKNLGFGWNRGYYIPVSVFTYADTFAYLMSRRNKLNEKECGEIKEYLYKFF